MPDPVPRFQRILLVGLSVCFLMGCGSSHSRFLSPEYERGSLRGASVALLPLSSDLGFAGSTAAKAEMSPETASFTAEGRDLFYRLFALNLQDVAYAGVSDLGSDFQFEDASLQLKSLPLSPEDSLQLPIPTEHVQLSNRQAKFLLLIDGLTFTPRDQRVQSSTYGSTKGRNVLHLKASCKYVLWDNAEDRVVAYGRFNGRTKTGNPRSRTPYRTLFEELARHVIEKSPIALAPQS